MVKQWRTVLPSKKFIAILVPVICAVIGITLWKILPQKHGNSSDHILAVKTPHTEVTEVDTDGDGLKDWQESLWGTQISLKDTDGDGTSDGDEVKMSRNPVIPGPNDKQLTVQNTLPLLADAALSDTADSESQTETDILSKLLLGQAINFKNGSAQIDPSAVYQIIGNLQGKASQKNLISPTQIAPADLTVVPATAASLKKYGNDFGTILSGTPTEETNELLVLGKFGQTKDVTVLAKLTVVADSYRSLIQELSAIPIPQTVAQEHLAFLNALAGISASIQNLSLIATDPFAGVFALQPYSQYAQERNQAFEEIWSILTASRISFTSDEPGYAIISYNPQQNAQ